MTFWTPFWVVIPFCGPNRSKDMTLSWFYHLFYSTGAFLSASVDPPFKESTDSALTDTWKTWLENSIGDYHQNPDSQGKLHTTSSLTDQLLSRSSNSRQTKACDCYIVTWWMTMTHPQLQVWVPPFFFLSAKFNWIPRSLAVYLSTIYNF